MADLKLSLTWDAYQKNICNGLSALQQKGEFVDMTIAADGHHVKVHQMIMSLVSPYIKELIKSAQSPHPIIFLNRISYQTLESILEYVYTGEVRVSREKLCDFLEACNALHIKGLENDNLKCTAEGDLLHLMGAKGVQNEEADQPPSKPALHIHTEIKRQPDEEYEDESYLMDDSPMDDDALEDFEEDVSSDVQKDNSETIISKPNPAMKSMIQYTLSCQGSIQLILNRYIYCMRHTRKNNERMWRCTEYNKSKCRAYTVTKGDVVLERGCAHNHPFQDKQILKRVRNGNVYTAFNAVESIATLTKKQAPAKTQDKKDVIS